MRAAALREAQYHEVRCCHARRCERHLRSEDLAAKAHGSAILFAERGGREPGHRLDGVVGVHGDLDAVAFGGAAHEEGERHGVAAVASPARVEALSWRKFGR